MLLLDLNGPKKRLFDAAKKNNVLKKGFFKS